MIFSLFTLILTLVIATSQKVEPSIAVELSPTENDIELEQSKKQLQDDCRYSDEPIATRNLSAFDLVTELSKNSEDEAIGEKQAPKSTIDPPDNRLNDSELKLRPPNQKQ